MALDTHVVVRLLVNDDQAQAKQAATLVDASSADFVPITMALELKWVLCGAYRLPRQAVIKVFAGRKAIPGATATEDELCGCAELRPLCRHGRGFMAEQLKLHPLQRDCDVEGQHPMHQQRGHWIQGAHRQESRRKPAAKANALTSAQYRAKSNGGWHVWWHKIPHLTAMEAHDRRRSSATCQWASSRTLITEGR